MKHIGIIGITAEGASLCYKTIVSRAGEKLGLYKHPKISLINPSFRIIYDLQQKEDWEGIAKLIAESVNNLASIGADFAIIPANSVHFAIKRIQELSQIPVLNIVDITTAKILSEGYKKPAVLGVGLTMKKGLFMQAFENNNIDYYVPDTGVQKIINDCIYNEIVPSKWNEKTVATILSELNRIKLEQRDSLVLACTELPLVINESNSPLPFIDTTHLLAYEALELALKED